MPKTDGFINRDSKDGTSSITIRKDNNARLNIYCQINGFNKTSYVNKLIEEDMKAKFDVLREAAG